MPPPADLARRLRLACVLADGEQLYAVLDAARSKDLARNARDGHQLPARMLFRGEAAEYMDEVAPWLVALDPGHPLLDEWAEAPWNDHAGILLVSAASPGEMLRHLRNIFVVCDESGQEYFFRFYDPRVLNPYLAAAETSDRQTFFGPIRSILACGSVPGSIVRHTVDQSALAPE